ncbi:hypothetical protein C8R47DRAFT_1088200 [Mycena vitilis]|nr:hypothetical protein C8R47DRAFT_1088200 [Mycena vitilis]
MLVRSGAPRVSIEHRRQVRMPSDQDTFQERDNPCGVCSRSTATALAEGMDVHQMYTDQLAGAGTRRTQVTGWQISVSVVYVLVRSAHQEKNATTRNIWILCRCLISEEISLMVVIVSCVDSSSLNVSRFEDCLRSIAVATMSTEIVSRSRSLRALARSCSRAAISHNLRRLRLGYLTVTESAVSKKQRISSRIWRTSMHWGDIGSPTLLMMCSTCTPCFSSLSVASL